MGIAEITADETKIASAVSFVIVNTSPEVEVLEFVEIVVFGDVVMLIGIDVEDTVDASKDEIVEDMLRRLVRSVEFIVICSRLTTFYLLLHYLWSHSL